MSDTIKFKNYLKTLSSKIIPDNETINQIINIKK